MSDTPKAQPPEQPAPEPGPDSTALLAPGLIHEMRHPLLGIKAGLQLISAQLGAQVSGLEEWGMITSQVKRLEELFRSYQDFLTPGHAPACQFPLQPVLQQAVDLLQFRLKRLGRRFSLHLAPNLSAFGSPNALLHATTNLLFNALDALEEVDGPGRLALRASAAGKRVQIRVSDEGSGVAPELEQRIFEERFTTKPEGKGTGLGLAIARRMIAASGGAVTLVPADDPDRLPWAKTEFCIELSNDASAAAPPEVATTPVPVRGRDPARYVELAISELQQQLETPPRVLLVDERRAALDALADRLGSLGVDFERARSAQEAIGLFERGAVHAAVVAEQVDGGMGVALVRELRELDARLPVYVRCAAPNPRTLEELFSVGARVIPEEGAELLEFQLRLVARRHALISRVNPLCHRLGVLPPESLGALPAPRRHRLEELERAAALTGKDRRIAALATRGVLSFLGQLPRVQLTPVLGLPELERVLRNEQVDLVVADPGQGDVSLQQLGELVSTSQGGDCWLILSERAPGPELLIRAQAAGATDVLHLERGGSLALQQRVERALEAAAEVRRARAVMRALFDQALDGTSLPARRRDGRKTEARPAPERARSAGAFAGQALVVEDEPVILGLLKSALAQQGYQVTPLTDGDAAIEELRRRTFDVLVADKNLPGANGVEVARTARALNPATVIMVVTSYASRESAEALRAIDIDAYLQKPFELDQFISQIRLCTERRKATMAGAAPAPGAEAVGARVLVLEPDPRERARLTGLLRSLGHTVVARPAGTSPSDPDAGFQGLVLSRTVATEQVRETVTRWQAAQPDLKVVLLSDSKSTEDLITAICLGAVGHLVRPLTDAQLTDALREALT